MQAANDTDRIAELGTERLMLSAAPRMALNHIMRQLKEVE